MDQLRANGLCASKSRHLGRLDLLAVLVLTISCLPGESGAQTTFHLHNETSSTGVKQLKTADPDVPAVVVQGPNLKGITSSQYVVSGFDSADTPTPSGTIPAGSLVSAKLWMRKTSNWGDFRPRFILFAKNTGGEILCTGTSETSVTTSFVRHDVSCTTSAAITIDQPYYFRSVFRS